MSNLHLSCSVKSLVLRPTIYFFCLVGNFVFQEDISAIFNKADKDNSGTLTVKEFQEVIDDICTRYPQVELYLKKKQMRNIVDLLTASKGDVAKESIELNIEEVKSLLSEVDSQMKNVPATAQVPCCFI